MNENRIIYAFQGFAFSFLSCLLCWYLFGLVLTLIIPALQASVFLWFGGFAGLFMGGLVFLMVLAKNYRQW
jgi:hypothetical protein